MFIKRPAEALLGYTRSFADDPQKYSIKIKSLADQEGYNFIKGTLDYLMQETTGKARAYVVLLRQPEWVWRQDKNILTRKVFGFNEGGEFTAWGFYVTGPQENGRITVYAECREESVKGMDIGDPRRGFLFRTTRSRLKSTMWLPFRGLAWLKNSAKSVINLIL
jgi:hypothetical protein